ncbi:MAG: hypothetical protein ABR559_00765 [Gemmatimonadota bacterium]
MGRGARFGLAGGAVAAVGLVFFALANQGQAIALTVGIAGWRGDAIVALYGAVGLGLLAMFALGLPADLASRRERDRLIRRVQELERAQPPLPPES